MKRSIEQKLERVRKDLNEMAEARGLQDPLVLKQSQFLDELVNRFVRQQHGKKAIPKPSGRTKGLPLP